MTLVTLVDDLHWELDGESVSLLVLLDLLVTFGTVDHGSFLGCIAGVGHRHIVLQWDLEIACINHLKLK